MKTQVVKQSDQLIAIIDSPIPLITDVKSALDLMATIHYELDCTAIIIRKEHIIEDFFDLKTGLAGEILQKFVTYGFRLGIIGDFSVYSSNSLRDFIRESNRGSHICFVPTKEEALDFLAPLHS